MAERDGSIAGFAAVLLRGGGDIELDGLFVEPEFWKGGFGKALVQRCIAFARERGARALHVIANPRAGRFYAACGFESAGEAQTKFGPARAITKSLAARTVRAVLAFPPMRRPV